MPFKLLVSSDLALPCIRAALQQETESSLQNSSTSLQVVTVTSETDSDPGPVFSLSIDGSATNFIFFTNDCIYHHKLLRFHFTTYDVRRGTDIVNAGTSCHNVMLLAEDEHDNTDGSTGSSNSHPFLYAQVLGVYHANMLYTGPGCKTMRHCVPTSYGCNGMSLLILHLQDGAVLSWTLSASHLCTKLIPLASWIWKTFYVGAILFQRLRKANDIQTRLEYHTALKIVMTTCYITLAGVLGARVIWQLCWHELMKFLGFLTGIWLCVIIEDWALVIFMPISPRPQLLQAILLLASQGTPKMIKKQNLGVLREVITMVGMNQAQNLEMMPAIYTSPTIQN